MLLKFICCDVFTRIACQMVSTSPHIVDLEFIPMLAHLEPEKLRGILQERINEAMKIRKYDAIILGYGICGNSVMGLQAPIPMIIPRMHDCCTMFMGSQEAFIEHFSEAPSTSWSSNGFFERADTLKEEEKDGLQASHKYTTEYLDLVEQYGEDNADYVWEMMYPETDGEEGIYIEIAGMEYCESKVKFEQEISRKKKKLKVVEGNTELMRRLVHGEWDEKRFLVLKPNEKIKPVYDMKEVLRAE